MMAMNPMAQMGAAMMGANMQAMMASMGNAANASASSGAPAEGMPAPPSEQTTLIDPRVKAICKEFSIDDQTCRTLHEAMKSREDYDEDMQALHQVMERAVNKGKKPLEIMLTQIRAIRSGKFAGKELLDKDIWNFSEKYNLDDRVLNRLIQTLNARTATKKQDLRALDERLSAAQQPTGLGLLVRLLEGLEETGRLPSPPRRLGGSGTFHPTGTFLHPASRDRERGRGGLDRDRERESGARQQARSRSRTRQGQDSKRDKGRSSSRG